MAQVAAPRKTFNFDVEIDGILSAQVQKVGHPEIEIEEVTHGDANYDVKTGGRIKYTKGTLEKLRPADQPDLIWWVWLSSVQNPDIGGGQLPTLYKQLLVIKEKAPDNITVVSRWAWIGAWPSKLSRSDNDRNVSENMIETVEISMDRVEQL